MKPTLIALALLAVSLQAFGEEKDFSRLERDLTPIGAERAGNEAGSIPAWEGGLTAPPPGWEREKGYIDPFPEDQPLFTITGANAAQYEANLTPGLVALLKQNDEFRMPVYQTRRTAALPKKVTDKLREQAPNVGLNGFGLKNLGGSTTPFPIPDSGLEVIWNHLVRYLGGGIERSGHAFAVRPNGDYLKFGFTSRRIYAQNIKDPAPNRLFYALGYFTEPATLKGTIFLVHEPVDQVAEERSAWIYNAGQRRVRRAPDLAYDGINDGSEGLHVTDQVDGYNGAPDRFEWKLLGKREVYVPYNAYKLSDKNLKYKEIIGKKTVNADLTRYELHRVWVVEGTLIKGQRHVYGRRIFYIDEDSWTVLIEDVYDTRGGLWRVSLHGLMQAYDVPLPTYRYGIFHDLNSRSYLTGGFDNEVKAPIKFDAKGVRREFSPSALRQLGGTL